MIAMQVPAMHGRKAMLSLALAMSALFAMARGQRRVRRQKRRHT